MLTRDELFNRAARIELIALDNDGVLTDGMVSISAEGIESKSFFIRDGFGVVMARRAGLKFAVITGLKSAIVEKRAEQLKIDEVHQGFVDKADVLGGIIDRHGLSAQQTAYMGDDIFDIPAMRLAGLGAAPADAHENVLEAADWVSTMNGGRGAVRELIELVIKARGLWDELWEYFVENRKQP